MLTKEDSEETEQAAAEEEKNKLASSFASDASVVLLKAAEEVCERIEQFDEKKWSAMCDGASGSLVRSVAASMLSSGRKSGGGSLVRHVLLLDVYF